MEKISSVKVKLPIAGKMMRVKIFMLLVLHFIYNVTLFEVAANNMSGTNDTSTLAHEALSEGIKLAKNKKLTKAKVQFETSKKYWQLYNNSVLYLIIIDDVENKVIKKKDAIEIFKSVYEDFIKFEPKKALKKINKIIKKNKDYFPARITKGEILKNLEDYEQSETEFLKAIELAPNSPLPHVFRAKYYVKMEVLKDAVEDFTKAIQIDPASTICQFERGFIYCLQKKYDKAITDFEAAIKATPTWENSTVVFEAFYNRGVLLLNKKSYRKAIKDFSRAIKIRPDYLNAYISRGLAYKNIRKYDKAISDFNYCIEKDPGSKTAYYQRAVTNYERGRFQKAVNDLEIALTFNRDDKNLYIKLGQSNSKLGKHTQAVTQFDKAIKLDKRYIWAYYWKGFALAGLRKPKQAIQSFKTFLALAPKKYFQQISLAEVEIKKLKAQY